MARETSDWRLYGMNVGQLRQTLEGLPDGMPVILQKDAEGNGYSPLSSADTDCVYEAESNWSGEVHDTTDPDYEADAEDFRVLLLGPVN